MPKYEKNIDNIPLEINKIEDEEIIINHFFLLIMKWKFIALITTLSIITGISIILLKPNIYEAEATLMVSSTGVYSAESLGNDEITRNQRLVDTYAEIARSRNIILNVISKLDMDAEPEDISKLLKMEPVGETELIKISYQNKNPQIAAIVVNEISEEFIHKIRSVMTFENLKVIEKAEIPSKPLPRDVISLALIFLTFGFFLSTFIIFVQELLCGKLKDPKDFETIMESQVLANIPDFKKIKEKERG